jgi:hypothetical protein
VTRSAFLVAGALLSACNASPPTYPGKCEQRLNGWRGPEKGIGELAIWNVVRVSKNGSVSWNRQAIRDETLIGFLRKVSTREPRPQIILTIEPGADCSRVEKVRQIMNATPICSRDGACGEGTGWKDPSGRPIS